ncbi:MAG: dockerin type I repeat-containing protein [Clostridia bacterium]|nr:dockerin type I repeat-containing protein [Clostridia bacterium]
MKKLISVLIIITMIMQCFIFSSSARGERPVVKGDANLDGVINALDVITVKKIIVGMEKYNKNADLVNDGVVNAKDLLCFSKLIVGKPYSDEFGYLTSFTVDRKTFQSFLDDMRIDILRNSEGSMYEEHIIYYDNEQNRMWHRTDLKTGEVSIAPSGGDYMYYNRHWNDLYSKIDFTDSVRLKALFSEQGIDLEEKPETVCMIDTPYRYPIAWVKCGEKNYFVEYIENEIFQVVPKVFTEEEYLAYAKERNATLIVNGVVAEDEYAVLNEDYCYCIVSFTNLLEAMGAQVEWKNERYADILYNGERYVLTNDPEYYNSPVFYGVDNDVNYDFEVILWGFGRGFSIEWGENDLLLNHYLISGLLSELGYNEELDADLENDTLIINYSTKE